jgi:plasmid stability protein
MRTEPEPTKRKPGRPPRRPEDRKRTNLTVRLDDELRDQLLDEATQLGRSFNAEVEHRLRLSLAGESSEAGLWLDMRAVHAIASGQVEVIITRDKTSRSQGVVLAQIPGEQVPTLRVALTEALAALNSEWYVKRQRPHSPGARGLDQVRDKLRVALALIEQLAEREALADAVSGDAGTTPAQQIEQFAHAMIDLARSLRLPRAQTAPVVEPQTTYATRRRK